MSTKSHIGIWNEDGCLDVIYCHWDGYPSSGIPVKEFLVTNWHFFVNGKDGR